MPRSGPDDAERLVVAWDKRADALQVFERLRDPMRQSARSGIRVVLHEQPDEDDVNDVVLKAFTEVLAATSRAVKRDPVAFSKVVAYRRGLDRGRAIVREREQVRGQKWELERLAMTDEDLLRAARNERLVRAAEDALPGLTPDQRDVIERTVMGSESLSDWAAARGTSYEAGRRLRARGLGALRKELGGNGAAGERNVGS